MTRHFNILIVGGGASGMMAAISAKRHGANSVAIVEKLDRVGKKILATGNGHCNLSNRNFSLDAYHGNGGSFPQKIFDQFALTETLDFFASMGLVSVSDPSGRLFPRSGQASSVLDLLRLELARLEIEEIFSNGVALLEKNNNRFELTTKPGNRFTCDTVILAAGGKAAPQFGCDGSGYTLAEKFGHTVIPPFPAIVQLLSDAPYLKQLKGVRCDVRLSLVSGNQMLHHENGELLFTDYGLSGIPALQMARIVYPFIRDRKPVEARINLFPEIESKGMISFLKNHFSLIPHQSLSDSLAGLLHKRLIPVLLKIAGMDANKLCGDLSEKELESLASVVTSWPVEIRGTKSWRDAHVTAGGIDTSEVDEETLQSKKTEGFFFAGEILDVDGDCGGYNLQWAWSSGYVAGLHAAEFVRKANQE